MKGMDVSVKIISYPRIHMSLLEMSGGLGRINGGIGFSIEDPQNVVSINSSNRGQTLEICEGVEIQSDKVDYINSVISNVCDGYQIGPCSVKLEKTLPSHHGLGSYTSIGMAIVEGLLLFNNLEYTKGDIIGLAMRGGTSGIGINTYFDGSFVTDLGHGVNEQAPIDFLPSSYALDRNHALRLTTIRFPTWHLLLVMPNLNVVSEDEEREFFRRNLPISERQSAESIRIAFFGILPSIMAEDYSHFCLSLRKLRKTKWKADEIALYGQAVWEIIERCEELGADASSMSSLGPLIYCFGKPEKLDRVEKNLVREFDLNFTMKTTPRNQGRELLVQ